jgi:transposase
MSLPPFSSPSALFSTAALTGPLFAPTDRYRLFAQLIYPQLLQGRSELAAGYCQDNGRPAVEPVLVLGVSLLQFLDGVPDQRAVELLQYHTGWNFALNRNVGDPLFHPTVLVYFRQRLLQHQQSRLIFAKIIDGLVGAGLMSRRSAQRMDSTQILGLVSHMSRLECMRQTLRLALEELEQSAQAFGRPIFWPELWERYVDNKLNYRLESKVLKEKMDQSGADSLRLLEWVDRLSDKTLASGQQVQVLRRVFDEQFEVVAGATPQQRPSQPAGAVHNPHDPEAQWAAKGQGKARKEHVGYKVQVAETVVAQPLEPGEPTRNFLTGIATQPAIGSDEAGAEQIKDEQKAMGLEPPPTLFVDGAYVSAQKLAEAQAQGQELIGPVQLPPKTEGKFSSEAFTITIAERKAICPAGKENTQCSRLEDKASGKVNYRFEWSYQCAGCPLREQCVGKDQKHRTLLVGEYHDFLQARRQEQKTEAFQKRAQHRNAIEGTQSELVRGHGLRRARYRGLAKVRLQNYFIGAACNAKRWIRRAIWEMKRSGLGAKASVASG